MPTHFHKTDLAANQHFAIILAAGFSTRMGICKTTLLWHNHQTLLRYQTEQFLQAGINPVVVLGEHNAHRQEDCAAGTTVVVKDKESNSKTQPLQSLRSTSPALLAYTAPYYRHISKRTR